jgi:hypothetical protein
MAILMDGPLESPGPGLVQTGLYADNTTGKVEPVQQGSQFWMNSDYTGPEPDLATKAAYSTAEYARDWAATYLRSVTASGAAVSPAVQKIVVEYPPAGATSAAAGTTLDLSGLTGMINAGVKWLTENILTVIIVVAAIIVLPRLLSAATSSGRRG